MKGTIIVTFKMELNHQAGILEDEDFEDTFKELARENNLDLISWGVI